MLDSCWPNLSNAGPPLAMQVPMRVTECSWQVICGDMASVVLPPKNKRLGVKLGKRRKQ